MRQVYDAYYLLYYYINVSTGQYLYAYTCLMLFCFFISVTIINIYDSAYLKKVYFPIKLNII